MLRIFTKQRGWIHKKRTVTTSHGHGNVAGPNLRAVPGFPWLCEENGKGGGITRHLTTTSTRNLPHFWQATKSVDVAKEMEGMKVGGWLQLGFSPGLFFFFSPRIFLKVQIGLLHFFDKLTTKQLRESPLSSIKVADLKHIMSSVGEKMTEDGR